MNARAWNGEPDRRDDALAHERPDPEVIDPQACFDCGEIVTRGATTVLVFVDAGVGSRRYCGPCTRWRDHRGMLFDARAKVQLMPEVASPWTA